jgi:ATP-dependent helicase/nuclease subunit A
MDAVLAGLARQQARCAAILEPSYAVAAAKAMALSASHLHKVTTTGEHGTEWGTVIHFLLEARMRNARADLDALARLALREQGLDESLVDEAVRIVRKVVSSTIWRRAETSPYRLFEVPMSAKLPASEESARPTLVRGVIDLVFRETGGWVIVDYKTDRVSTKDLPKLVDHYRPQINLYTHLWASVTQEPVQLAGLYFTQPNEFVEVQ